MTQFFLDDRDALGTYDAAAFLKIRKFFFPSPSSKDKAGHPYGSLLDETYSPLPSPP